MQVLAIERDSVSSSYVEQELLYVSQLIYTSGFYRLWLAYSNTSIHSAGYVHKTVCVKPSI